MMASIRPFLTDDQQIWATLPQLHNDVLDFAVAAGIIGVVVYLLILATPLIAALRSPPDRQRAYRLYAAVTIGLVYACAGLTDIMIGFEFHTTFFGAVAGIVLGMGRDRPARAGA